MHKTTQKKRPYRPRTEEPSGLPFRESSSEIPNSALLSMLAGGAAAPASSSADALESRLLARQPQVPPQIPQAEQEADQLSASITGGTPESVKSELGRKLGADFSGVHFHTGADAVARASAMDARAFTTGSDVYFGQGGFDPSIAAHELVHTVQQGVVDSGVSTLSAPTNQVQMWPWSKKKSTATGDSADNRGFMQRMFDKVKKPVMSAKQWAFDKLKNPTKRIFDWAERRSGHQVDPKEVAPLDLDLDNFFEEDLTAPKAPEPKKTWWRKAGSWIKNKASSALEWGKDKVAGTLTSMKRKNELAVDQYNTFGNSHMPLYKRILWDIRNPIARLTASHRKKGTEQRAAHREAIEEAAAEYTDNHLRGQEQEDARRRRGEVYTPEEEAEYAKLLQDEDEDAPQELSDEETDKMMAELEQEADDWYQNWSKEHDSGPAMPKLGPQFDDAELEAEYEALLKDNDGKGQDKGGGLSLEDLEAEAESEEETDPYQGIRDMMASLDQGPTDEDVAAAQARVQRLQEELDQMMAQAEELLNGSDDLEEGEEGEDTKFTLDDGLSLADTITGNQAGDLDEHYKYMDTGGLEGEKMSRMGQGAGFLNSALGIFSSARETRDHWRTAQERAAIGDDVGKWSNRLRALGSGLQGGSSATTLLQYADPTKFKGLSPASAGLSAAGNYVNGTADTVDAVDAGARTKRMAKSREALEARQANGEKLDKTDELILRMSRQGEGMAKADTIQYGSSAAGNFAKGIGDTLTATGAGGPAGKIISGIGTLTQKVGGAVAEGKRKDVRTQVVNEEYALEKRIERYMKAHPNVSYNEAKQIVIKGRGFRSGKRSEMFGNATIQRVDQAFAAEKAGDQRVSTFLDDLGVAKVNGARSRKLAGDRLGLRGEGELEERVEKIAASRDFVNPFAIKKKKR